MSQWDWRERARQEGGTVRKRADAGGPSGRPVVRDPNRPRIRLVTYPVRLVKLTATRYVLAVDEWGPTAGGCSRRNVKVKVHLEDAGRHAFSAVMVVVVQL